MKFISKSKSYHKSRFNKTPVGTTDSQIVQLEKYFEVTLPLAYKEFLSWMGNDHEGVFQGSDWFAKDLIENTEYLPDLLADNGVEYNASKACAFFCHQGYMIAWFELESGEDPRCFFFSETDSSSIKTYDSFSLFLEKELRGLNHQ